MKTIHKIFISKFIYKLLTLLGFKKNILIEKSSIKWKLDISEGIDLSIFLFGGFQKPLIFSILKLLKKISKNKSKIIFIDIGSNIGDKSLSIARKLISNRINNFEIFSIEPTEFAYNKQEFNINLNPDLKKKINLDNYFISDNKKQISKIYSSWSLNKKHNYHRIHGGYLKKVMKNTKIISLDEFIYKKKIKDNIIVKIDVDGSELDVLRSCKKSLRKKNIIFFMEYAPYAFEEHGENEEQFFDFIKKNNLKIYDLKFRELKKIKIWEGKSIDIILAKNINKKSL